MTETAYTYSQGLVIPDTSATLAEVQNEYTTAFGTGLVLDPSTPQGVLISAETLARDNFINNNAAIANLINPNYAGGTALDAVLALTGVQRTPATPTVVTGVTVTGVSGTTIPVGSLAATAAGDQFQTTQAVVIPAGGSTTVNFQSVSSGAIPCAISALNTIVTAVLGWETVGNTVAGVVGSVTQSDQQARSFRQNTLFFQGKSLAGAITSALYAVPGVTSLAFQENYTSSTATINGITMLPNSVYACVSGGVSTAIAAALLENKSSGAAWNGGTTVSVVEPASLQTYQVKYDVPTPVAVGVKATVHNITSAAATQAILDYAAGNIPNVTGFVVGSSVSPFDIAGAIISENPGGYVPSVTVGLASGTTYSTTPLSIAVNQIATLSSTNISITVV